MKNFHSLCSIIAGILCFHASCEAKISDLHPNLQAPPYVKTLQNSGNSADQLHKISQNQDLPEFYKAANLAIAELTKIKEKRNSLSDIEKKNGLWLLNLIAQAPLLDLSQKAHVLFARQSDDLDLSTKERALDVLFLSKSRELLEQDKDSLSLISTYYASILGDLIKFSRNYSPPASPLNMNDDLTKSLLAEVENTLEGQVKGWKSNRKNIKDSEVEEKEYKWGTELNRQLAEVQSRYTDVENVRHSGYLRYRIVSESIPRMESLFIKMLVRNFPGKKSQVLQYIKMAGYKNDEINDLIDRTVGRDSKTEFLYKGRSKRAEKK